jgi:PilZ domain
MPPKVTRKCVRYPVDWEVKTFNGQPVTETSVSDLSAVGAKLEGPKPLAPRNHVEFTYIKPGDDRERRHTGVVMWMRPLIHKPGRYQMGVNFFETDWSLDQELRQGVKF